MAWYHGATRAQWMALTAALLGWMFDGYEMGIFPLVARPALVDLLGFSPDTPKAEVDAAVGPWNAWITAAFLVGAAFGGWGFGWLGDRVGRVRAMMFAVLTYAIFTGVCGFAQSPWQLAGFRFISALGMGGEWALGVALVMESWPAHARPWLAGLIGAAGNVGYVLTSLVAMSLETGGFPIGEGGWRWILGVSAFPALLTFIIRFFVPESEQWKHAQASGPKPSLVAIFAPGLWQRTIPGALLGAVALVATWASIQWIVPWTNSISGRPMDGYIAQICSGIGAACGCIGAAVLGADRSRRLGYAVMCILSLIVCQTLFRGFNGVSEVGLPFFGMVFLAGLTTASFYGWLPLYLPELFPTRLRATGQGFCFNCGRLIAAGGALTTGALMSKDGIFAGNFAMAGATMSLIYLVGLVVIWIAPETRGKPMPE
ncbi:MFS transporter [Tuwongella immobilis]|uniref:Major facilitator superfamily (MFS) profile domain-containing protein n=1 Tax=Tuwongella immobilis TaxID=692036 RepID=A0A6C2YSB3_9BACT|nr:MFS transporter [Tuwongella immobilis]VIP04237.1 mfs transporter : Major facilitator superfamily transporter OS=Candidatus Nitrospira defluvii GN=NIDE1155 PE=4 SV=1: Sugar_tr [Tuwongella immobilis]VTS05838.1 mfs transporter : Major facilitator superfamily transporter OS=Candidatus Nitrospira defluvii GN=NIDE1155 PE=4 SV=1: Sugar_tr [Tuwongella immobilis]